MIIAAVIGRFVGTSAQKYGMPRIIPKAMSFEVQAWAAHADDATLQDEIFRMEAEADAFPNYRFPYQRFVSILIEEQRGRAVKQVH